MRSRDIIQYPLGKHIMFSIGEHKYVGTLMRYRCDYHQALLLVGFSTWATLLFNNVFVFEKKKKDGEACEKQKVSIFRFTAIKNV